MADDEEEDPRPEIEHQIGDEERHRCALLEEQHIEIDSEDGDEDTSEHKQIT